jgi:dynein regulatry complex protein 1
MEWKQERLEDDLRQVEQLQIRDSEEYNMLKIKLEDEIQTLEQQLQEVFCIHYVNIVLTMS